MMDPTTGRWLTQDPDGFTAEDMNLYRYVKNSPTNLTDPTGLQEMPIKTEGGKPVDIALKDSVFDILGGKGAVEIFIDRKVTNRKGVAVPGKWIQFRFFSESVELSGDWHWLQFGYFEQKDGDTIDEGFNPFHLSNRKTVWRERGEKGRFIDTTSPDTTQVPYYDNVPGVTRRSKNELSIIDNPTYHPTTDKYTTQTWHFDTFLVNAKDKKVYYQIQWELRAVRKDGTWSADYVVTSAKPTSEVPDWAKADNTFLGGYPDKKDEDDKASEPVKDNPLKYPNPLKGFTEKK